MAKVTFDELNSAQDAISEMNGVKIDGNPIKVWLSERKVVNDVRKKFNVNKYETTTAWGKRDNRNSKIRAADYVKVEKYFSE